MVKRQIEIEKLLHWAYRDELSKRHSSSAEGAWNGIAQMGQLGIASEKSTPQRYDFGETHPDAEKIEKAVGALEDQAIDLEPSIDGLMGDLAPLLRHRDVMMTKTLRTAVLVTMHSFRLDRPDWCPETPRPHWIEATHGPRGRPRIVGECRGRDLYTAGSHCPLEWDPSPIDIALARLDYVAWHRGLVTLAQTLELDAHEVMLPAAHELPWFEDQRARGRVFAFGEVTREKLPLKPQRDYAGPPRPRRRKDSVTIKLTPEMLA